jgi:hypothetical protein
MTAPFRFTVPSSPLAVAFIVSFDVSEIVLENPWARAGKKTTDG